MKATIPNFAQSEVSGWDGSTMASLPFEINSGSVDAEFEFSASPVIGVEIFAIGIISYEAALKVRMPRVKTKFTSFEDPAGVCGGSDPAQTKGVRSNTEVAFALDFVVGEDKLIETKPPIFEKTLWEHKLPATEGCTVVGAPADPQKITQGFTDLARTVLDMVKGAGQKAEQDAQ